MKQTVIVAIIVAIVVGTGALYTGMAIGKNRTSLGATNGFARGVNGGSRQMNGQFGGGMARTQGEGLTTGKIIAKDDQSITIETPNNGSKIVFVSTSTAVTKSTEGSSADLSVGTNVVANGKTNSDGSVSATMVQIRPEGSNLGGRMQNAATQN